MRAISRHIAFRAGRQKLPHHGFPHGIPGATDAAHPLIHQEVFQQKPAELVGEFEGLNQALLLQQSLVLILALSVPLSDLQ